MDNIVVLKDMDDVPGFRIKIIAQRSVQLQWSTKETFTISRSASTGCYIKTLWLTTLSLVQSIKSNDPFKPYLFLSTVEDNKSYFSSNEIEGANNARKVQHIIGWPITSNSKYLIKKQPINNCNVTINYINRAELIYGPGNPLLQGKIYNIPTKFIQDRTHTIALNNSIIS